MLQQNFDGAYQEFWAVFLHKKRKEQRQHKQQLSCFLQPGESMATSQLPPPSQNHKLLSQPAISLPTALANLSLSFLCLSTKSQSKLKKNRKELKMSIEGCGVRDILCHANRPQVFCARITFLIWSGKIITIF